MYSLKIRHLCPHKGAETRAMRSGKRILHISPCLNNKYIPTTTHQFVFFDAIIIFFFLENGMTAANLISRDVYSIVRHVCSPTCTCIVCVSI